MSNIPLQRFFYPIAVTRTETTVFENFEFFVHFHAIGRIVPYIREHKIKAGAFVFIRRKLKRVLIYNAHLILIGELRKNILFKQAHRVRVKLDNRNAVYIFL